MPHTSSESMYPTSMVRDSIITGGTYTLVTQDIRQYHNHGGAMKGKVNIEL